VGIDTEDLFGFIGATRADEWHRLLALHGGDPDEAQTRFAQRLAAELDRRVLSAGVGSSKRLGLSEVSTNGAGGWSDCDPLYGAVLRRPVR